ncbi:energy-coupling factor transporter ATPase [Desulforamulus ruminis]|uniref:Energy-coupling factor transporter ATP-binding protein EcfA2 n=1 Tax=Desulforamulus ruminis (strain ATCC 23193 / DSM 2154 / NCIMB 8452 / DL) TaxID=696281 RepID=F6DPF3_DESRL|nr:energy-coupling factor transporter ATPase [Desulforamulus ruminis]AEG58626.1 ABC transporter related protein [Desulforamulus ruminis DSM 2154]
MREVITIKNLEVTYAPETPFEQRALQNINITVQAGEFRAIIGPQGSGKSTLLQVMAGLIPGRGTIRVCDEDLTCKKTRAGLWRKAGVVFQSPERQLFEDTVFNDVAYGPVNLGLPQEEVEQRVKRALEMVKLEEQYHRVSPFALSGGQQRRAAIAGILALQPEVLLLDEPTAGLDPRGRRQLMDLFSELCREHGTTVVLVTHDMEEVAHRAHRVTVLHQGKMALEGSPRDVFARRQELQELGLTAPFAAELAGALKQRELPVRGDIITLPEAEEEVEKLLLRGRNLGSSC